MLTVEHLEKEYGFTTVLKDVSFSIGRGQKIALIGNNGSGKSTFLKILAGRESYDRGTIRFDSGVSIGYVSQEIEFLNDQTIFEFLHADLEEFDDLFERRARMLLKGFGFRDADTDLQLSMLSGGQQRKVCLVRLFLQGADVFLLDEPTNDLDLPSIIWLECLLMNSDATVLVASHDRRFLDKLVSKILEIDDVSHSVSLTNGTYSEYLAMSEKKREHLLMQYQEQRNEISRLEHRIGDLKFRAQKGNTWTPNDHDKLLRDFKRDRSKRSGKRAKAIERRIDQMDKIEKPFERKPLEILLPKRKKQGNCDLLLQDAVAGYPQGFHLKPCTLHLPFGTRCGLIGLNGRGKTTLLRTIVGAQASLSGEVRIGSGIHFGHLTQQDATLDCASTPLDVLRSRAELDMERAYLFLDIFGIDPKCAHDPIGSLSPGKRVRLILALFSALEVNVLVLDEPTNHLDLEALSALEDALGIFKGTVILVSHDRMFIERMRLDMIYVLDESGTVLLIKDYGEYITDLEHDAIIFSKALRSLKGSG